MRDRRQAQRSFADGFITEQVGEFWDDWMRAADQVLDDDDLVATVYEALVKRRTQSRTRGRPGFAADVVLRLLLLKHIRNWSCAILEREVRTNLLYRQFTRVGGGKVPDAKTLGRLGLVVGPEAVARLHQRVVWRSQRRRAWSRGGRCAWTRRWSRPTFTIRRTAACWATACACSRA